VPRGDVERTLNMGVGFCAVVPEGDAEEAIRLLDARGTRTWSLGGITPEEDTPVDPDAETVRGAKGVAGGAVHVVGDHP
jgi:phosphoribosylformylglycinamidine cyclo-ligase